MIGRIGGAVRNGAAVSELACESYSVPLRAMDALRCIALNCFPPKHPVCCTALTFGCSAVRGVLRQRHRAGLPRLPTVGLQTVNPIHTLRQLLSPRASLALIGAVAVASRRAARKSGSRGRNARGLLGRGTCRSSSSQDTLTAGMSITDVGTDAGP